MMFKKIDALKAIKITIFLIILCIIVLLCMVLFWKNNTIYENVSNTNTDTNDLISIMLETSQNSGMYEMSSDSSWPSIDNYEFNEDLSYCENGSVMTWNEADNSITVNVSTSESCWVYFDIIPPDVTITTNNTNITAYNASTPASLSCTDATSTYNQQYQAIEINNISSKYATCTLTYETPSTVTYLNDYVISLAGTTSGIGKVVDEGEVYYGDYSSASTIDESEYGTVSQFYSSSASSTSGTSTSVWSYSNGAYTSDAGSMTSGKYYHLSTTVQTSGYYQVCYSMSAGSTANELYVYVGGTVQYLTSSSTYVNAGSSTSKSGCVDLGYIATGTVVKFTQRASTTISSVSIYLQLGSESDVGSAGIRYEGKNPNNYVWYNNELWRIIGVFDENIHGVSGENLVKIIRSDMLDAYAWHKSNRNDWTTANLNSLLNEYYYYGLDGTESGYCYGYCSYTDSLYINKTCDYSLKGLNTVAREMVQEATWYLGGYWNSYINVDRFFAYERSGEYVYSGRSTSITGNVGLIYASDYGYSVLSSSCARTVNMSSYNTVECGGQSWLYGSMEGGNEWTITTDYYSSSSVFYVNSYGYLIESNVDTAFAVRPVLYLSSDVYLISGSGTMSDPYRIGM